MECSQIDPDMEEGQIPNISKLTKETRLNKKSTIPDIENLSEETRINKKKIAEEKFNDLLLRTRPFFEESLKQINKATKVGFNSCCVKCEEEDVANELARQYVEAKYVVKYTKPNLVLTWPI